MQKAENVIILWKRRDDVVVGKGAKMKTLVAKVQSHALVYTVYAYYVSCGALRGRNFFPRQDPFAPRRPQNRPEGRPLINQPREE